MIEADVRAILAAGPGYVNNRVSRGMVRRQYHCSITRHEPVAMLSAAGFACQGCRTIEAAIVAVEADQPDLILTALQVHGVSGMEICRYVREKCDRTDVPVMFLSAAQTPDSIRRRDGGHGIYYLRRLIERNVLLELIEKVLPASCET